MNSLTSHVLLMIVSVLPVTKEQVELSNNDVTFTSDAGIISFYLSFFLSFDLGGGGGFLLLVGSYVC